MTLLEKLAKHRLACVFILQGTVLTDNYWDGVKAEHIQSMSNAMDVLLNEGGLSQQAQDEIYLALHSDAP